MEKRKQFSWERPIEEAILDYVRYMAQIYEKIVEKDDVIRFLWWKIDLDKDLKERASHYVQIYRAVEDKIMREKIIREKINEYRKS